MSGVRFAPSPTGRFHIGNLRTAWISWRLSKTLRMPWIVRFEDIDRPRVLPGAIELQLSDLRELKMIPDQIVVQSERHERHWQLFQKAIEEGMAYPCTCSRKDVAASAPSGFASAPHLPLGAAPPLYTGKCRSSGVSPNPNSHATVAWRFRNLDESGSDDFVIARTARIEPDASSFVPSYHWACAIDDDDGRYDWLVRAADLASATAIQREIQGWLAALQKKSARFASVFHAALVLQNDGSRLEKRTRGVTFEELRARGVGPDEILEAFRQSFDERAFCPPIQSGEIRGEARQSIRLNDFPSLSL